MPARMPEQFRPGAGILQVRDEALRQARRTDRIRPARSHKHAGSKRRSADLWLEGNERVHQRGRLEQCGIGENDTRQNVRAVGITETHHRTWALLCDMRAHEVFHLLRGAREIVHIVNAFVVAPEKAPRAVLLDISSRRNNGSFRKQRLRNRQQLHFVPAGPMKKEQQWRAGRGRYGQMMVGVRAHFASVVERWEMSLKIFPQMSVLTGHLQSASQLFDSLVARKTGLVGGDLEEDTAR